MVLDIYVPLLTPALAVPLVRWLAGRLHPAIATWLVAACAAMLAGGALVALALLMLAGLSVFSVVASLGHWSTATVRAEDVAHLPSDLAASVLLLIFGTAGATAAVRRMLAIARASRAARLTDTGSELLVVRDDRPLAHALPGRPGRIVVSTSMLGVLAPAERRALLAHERAHLTGRHHLFVAVVDVLGAANPLLRPLSPTVRYTTERWADEVAARRVGDRSVVAHAVGKAALATRHAGGQDDAAVGAGVAMAAAAGSVPRRVAALLTTPPTGRLRSILGSRVGPIMIIAIVLSVASALFALAAAIDLHHVLELAQAASGHPHVLHPVAGLITHHIAHHSGHPGV